VFNIVKAVIGFSTPISVMVTNISGRIKRAEAVKCSVLITTKIPSVTEAVYVLVSWSRVLDKLTGLQLVKKFPAFYGTRRFITAFTSVHHLPVS
jgi:hypothetical protein